MFIGRRQPPQARDPKMTMNRAYFGIQYVSGSDMWLNEGGNIGSQMCAEIFDTAEEAQRFLDTRRLRPGFRPHLRVTLIPVARLFEMAATAQKYATDHGDAFWTARAAVLANLLPAAPLAA